MAMGLINTNIFGVSPRSSVCYKILSIMKVLSILYFRILIFNIFFYARNYLMTIQNHLTYLKLMLMTNFLICFIISIYDSVCSYGWSGPYTKCYKTIC